MCLYERTIRNPKYKPNKKNGGRWPVPSDPRFKFIPIECGHCIECRKKKARDWQVRLLEDVKTNTNGIFVTLTFSNQSIAKLCKRKKIKGLTGYEKDNMIATEAVRLFTERWRKKFKKQPRHWLITELGHEGTENIHLHGFIWTNESKETIRSMWGYGWLWLGKEKPDGSLENYVTERTVNYCIKYILKMDLEHKYYRPKIYTSKGMGKNYTETINAEANKFRGEKTRETYVTRTGHKMSLPKYWRNKIFNEDEREELWRMKLDRNVKYLGGYEIEVRTREQWEEYYRQYRIARRNSNQLGYGSTETDWEKKEAEIKKRNEMYRKRLEKELNIDCNPNIAEREVPF